ncbi:MFS transporter, partial [Auritidibacter ignavus]|uniref:MFS transporter n=1 Tax=Auritidibacter ignavus TaxID=678932 RepID=UPI002FE5A97F
MSPLNTQERRKQTIRAGSASTLGWAMDLHDLMLLLYITPVIAPLFFPAESPTLELAGAYAAFAVSLVMRPIGSIWFGNYADKHGRKKAAYWSIGGVGVITALMGLVPTYLMIGMAGTLIFLLLRLAQGVFVGGIVASTHTLGTESVSPKHRGLMSGIIAGGGAGIGAVLVALNYMFFTGILSQESFVLYGWRLMFGTGILTSIVSIWLFIKSDESPVWKDEAKPAVTSIADVPQGSVFSKGLRLTLLMSVILVAGGASLYYLTAGFFPSFFEINVGLTPGQASLILIGVNLTVAIFGPIGGHLSDRFGRKRIFIYLGLANALLGPIFYFQLAGQDSSSVVTVMLLALTMTALTAMAQGPVLIFLNERFPTRLRGAGTALSWNIGYAFAGMTPTFVTLLSPEVSDLTSRAALLLGVAALLMGLASIFMKEDRSLK